MKRPYTLGLYEKSMPSQLGWKEKLEAAKGAGFDFVEISIDETEEKLGRLDMSEEERLGLVSLMKEAGLPYALCVSADTASFRWEAAILLSAAAEWRLWRKQSG